MLNLSSGWKNTPYKNYFFVSLTLTALAFVIILLTKSFLPPVVPLFYGRPLNENQLAPTLGLVIPLFVSTFVTLLNLFLNFVAKDVFLKKILITSSLLVSILVTITVVKIIFLIGFF